MGRNKKNDWPQALAPAPANGLAIGPAHTSIHVAQV